MEIAYISLAEAGKLDEARCRDLFPRRLDRAGKFAHREDYLRCIGAGALLAGVLRIREEELVFDPFGKPSLTDGRLHFNLSHSGGYVVLAADTLPVGVDIEQKDDRHLSVAPRVYTEEELHWMAEAPAERFTVLWTMKESVLKNTGRGLTASPRSFSVLPLITEGQAQLFGRMRYGAGTALGNCRLSVCADRPLDGVSCRSYSADELMDI